jgi:hypothetical protein
MCRLEIKNELVPNQYGFSFVLSHYEPQHSSLVRLELLVLSNLSGKTDTHCAISSDTTSKKKRITASTGKRDHRHAISNLNSMLVELADGECHPLIYHFCTTGQLSNRESSNRERACYIIYGPGSLCTAGIAS